VLLNLGFFKKESSRTSKKRVSIFAFWDGKGNKKNFWTREMGNPTGEEIGVPVSQSSRSGFQYRYNYSSTHYVSVTKVTELILLQTSQSSD
jgi:hypothetical protein